ncbi:MAG: UbiA family prenyltransferase [Salinibacterium sp.]|nr:UbiA family prenyltransferase [Salinibacterium sp.]
MRKLAALALSTHPGPTIAVTLITVVLGFSVGLEWWRLLLLGLALLANQVSVGLSNDWLDADRDRAVGRTDKPVAIGAIGAGAVRTAAFASALFAVALTVPLGWAATVAHATFILSAWSYNAGLKSTVISVVPYIISFGLLPLVVTLSLPHPAIASPWAMLAGALLGIAAHFANVLPDLTDDAATGIRGLAHRAGARTAGLVIAGTLAGASTSVVLGLGYPQFPGWIGLGLSVVLAVTCAALVLAGRSTRLIFRLIIAGALIDVALLAMSGTRLLA